MALMTDCIKCCHCGGLLQDLRFLPIARRGHFFQDSFFSNIHQHFNAAVRNVLDSWGDHEIQFSNQLSNLQLHHTDLLQRYRQLRSQHLQEENQAVTVASDNSSHQMVLDVHEFSGGDVRVKLVGEGELVVEGQVEKTAGGGSSTSTHKFTKKFTLPESTDLDAITSVMSSDGILTITAPKQGNSGPKTTVIPIQVEGATPSLQSQFSCESCYETKPREYRVPIQQEDGPQVPLVPAVPTQSQMNNFGLEMDFPKFFLPVARNSLFFSDTYFQDVWDHFHRAMQDVLSRWGQPHPMPDLFSSYRDLRNRDLREDNQASTASEDQHQHKFAIDVKDFTEGGEVQVKAVNDRELVVEGRVDKHQGGATSTKRFHKRFTVPGRLQLDAISSALSSDGVLTITAPKREPTIQIRDADVPLSVAGQNGTIIPIATDPATPQPATPQPITPQSTTPQPITPQQVTAQPVTPQSATPQAYGPQSATPAYIVEEPVTPKVAVDQSCLGSPVVPCEPQPGMFHAIPAKVIPGDMSSQPRSLVAQQQEGEVVDPKNLYKTRNTGKFPIKISGSVINSNDV